MTLDGLPLNKKAVIIKVLGEGSLRRRLLDMGLTPKTEVSVVRKAPSGDPLVLFFRGYELSIRKKDARKILLDE